MCFACEQAAVFQRFEYLKAIAEGRMPEGLTEADLRAMDLPLPGEVEVVEEADGTLTLRPVGKPDSAAPSGGSFVCDSPDQ